MGLTLLAGPANAGKIELLLERYLARLADEPVLIVPNASDVEARERDLLRLSGALLGGWIGTFDDLFRRLAKSDPAARPVATDAQRGLVARAAVAAATLNGLGRSARHAGFADSLVSAVAELESGLLEPEELEGDLASLYAAYRSELDRRGLWDAELLRARGAARVAGDLAAWSGAPVFAYGFEDLTGAEWALLEALAGRSDVVVSLPYEPGRPAFAAVQDTARDLASLANGQVEELGARFADYAHPALAHLERSLFTDPPHAPAAIDGAIRFFEGAGTRGTLELVGEELLSLVRAGTPPERIALVCPSVERLRAPLETALGTLGVPYAVEGRARLPQTPFGRALLALLRFAWLGGTRADLYAYLRSPFSGASRQSVDFAEGRLRGRAISEPERVLEETERLREGAVPGLAVLRQAGEPVPAVREVVRGMARAAYGTEAPPVGDSSRADLRAYEGALRLLEELDGWVGVGGALSREDVVAALERATVRGASAGEPGRIAVTDLRRARTRRFDVVFVLGLEEGSFPRRPPASPFLDDDERRRLGRRLVRPDAVEVDRYVFYTACTRPTRRLYLVREAATDDGAPLEPSPFWQEARSAFDPEDVARWTRRRALSQLTWPVDGAPTDRERLRAVAVVAERDVAEAEAIASANGWGRRVDRALRAFERTTRLTHPLVLERLAAKTTFNVTELERMADCSSAWLFERYLDPRTIDAEADAKLRGSVAHTALYRFFGGLPKELGVERLDEHHVEDAVRFMRACLDEAMKGVRMELTALQRRELDAGLWRDLEQLVRVEAAEDAPFVPRRLEVGFGSDRSAPELQRGLDVGGVTVSGKIDRIDVDPFSARGIVVDYKSGKSAHSAQEIESELRLQIPLYMLVLRDLVGIEPLGGVYRPLGGARRARGLLRKGGEDTEVEGFAARDYRDEEAFWTQVDGAKELARSLASRIHEGDVRHDPKGGQCPSWCDLWTMCRVRRA